MIPFMKLATQSLKKKKPFLLNLFSGKFVNNFWHLWYSRTYWSFITFYLYWTCTTSYTCSIIKVWELAVKISNLIFNPAVQLFWKLNFKKLYFKLNFMFTGTTYYYMICKIFKWLKFHLYYKTICVMPSCIIMTMWIKRKNIFKCSSSSDY